MSYIVYKIGSNPQFIFYNVTFVPNFVGSALIEMALRSSAEMASTTERGFAGNPLKIKLIADSIQSHETSSSNADQSNNISTTQQTSSFQDYESLVLRKMRQAEERKRLEEEILLQDKLDEGATT